VEIRDGRRNYHGMRIILIILLLFGLGAPPAAAEVGVGDITGDPGNIIGAIGAKPISQVGEDAIRFSTAPALGGRAWWSNSTARILNGRLAKPTSAIGPALAVGQTSVL